MVIPAGFSRVLTGAGQQADSATLLVERSPVTGVSDQIVLDTLSEAATQGLAKGVATQYLDNIFVATTELGAGLAETSAQVQELAGGVGQVAEDADTAAGQSQQLTRQAGAAASQASTFRGPPPRMPQPNGPTPRHRPTRTAAGKDLHRVLQERRLWGWRAIGRHCAAGGHRRGRGRCR